MQKDILASLQGSGVVQWFFLPVAKQVFSRWEEVLLSQVIFLLSALYNVKCSTFIPYQAFFDIQTSGRNLLRD